jgi:serine/threonine protein kinase
LDGAIELDDFIPISQTYPTHLDLHEFSNIRPYAEGTSSILYRAKYGITEVVIKMIRKSLATSSMAMKEFAIEMSILERVEHSNIVRYIGSGIAPRLFFVMEYFDGGTLGDYMKRVSGSGVILPLKKALQWGRELAHAMLYLHSNCAPGASVLHRDMKPDNIGLANGSIVLFDFGLSACVRSRRTFNEVYEMTGFTGTLRYMAPEVALNRPYTERVDVYSFGILLWQLASGKTPFKGFSRDEFMTVVVEGGMRPGFDSHWPNELCELIESCWEAVSESRPSFETVVSKLDRIYDTMDNLECFIEM